MSNQALLEGLKQAIIEGDEVKSADIAKQLKQAGADVLDVINSAIKPATDYVGDKYEKQEFFLPELVVAGDAASAALDVLLPKGDKGKFSKATVITGTIYGDIHEIGKNIVSSLLMSNGYNVINLGTDVHPNKFVEEAKKNDARFIGISCLLSPSMFYMKDVIKRLTDEGLRDKIMVIIGGASIDPSWAREIGADGWARDAERAVQLADRLLKGEQPRPLIIGG
jgi:5-methyltetrahydrofolate--homocysteine methyltransferase